MDNQLDAVTEYVTRRGWTVVERYVDDGVSGTTRSRPGLDAMLSDARRRRFDAIVAWSFDRVGRSLGHLVEVAQELDALDIQLVTLREAVDTTTPMGRFFFHLCGSFAEFERELMRDRINAGLARAKRKGTRLGRPASVVIDAARVAELRATGKSGRAIAAELGIPETSLRRMLKDTQPRS